MADNELVARGGEIFGTGKDEVYHEDKRTINAAPGECNANVQTVEVHLQRGGTVADRFAALVHGS